MEQPLVSVVTPVYNHGRYIGRCIDSLLAQTYTNWEMVVVDDGSTDNTAEVVRSYEDPRITYVHQENRGVKRLAETINNGVRRTKGALITMFASDDIWPPYRLEKQIPAFEDPNVVLCFGRGALIDENDRVILEGRAPANVRTVENRPIGSVLYTMLANNFIPQYTVLLRRAALERIGLYLQPPWLYAEDYPTHLALALEGEFRYLDLTLGYYRMHQGQMTRIHYLEMIQTDTRYVMEFFRGLKPEIQQRTGWTEATLAKERAQQFKATYFEVGRRHLLVRDWKRARQQFGVALRHGNPKSKAKACLGLGCSLLHKDLEWAVRLSGRVPSR